MLGTPGPTKRVNFVWYRLTAYLCVQLVALMDCFTTRSAY